MKLIICRRRYEIKRDTPHLDVEEEIRKNITSLLTDETEVIRLKEPEKKQQTGFIKRSEKKALKKMSAKK